MLLCVKRESGKKLEKRGCVISIVNCEVAFHWQFLLCSLFQMGFCWVAALFISIKWVNDIFTIIDYLDMQIWVSVLIQHCVPLERCHFSRFWFSLSFSHLHLFPPLVGKTFRFLSLLCVCVLRALFFVSFFPLKNLICTFLVRVAPAKEKKRQIKRKALFSLFTVSSFYVWVCVKKRVRRKPLPVKVSPNHIT